MRSAVQLYTLRGLDATLPELLAMVGSTGLDGVEFAGLDGSAPARVAAALEGADLSVAGAHVDATDLERDAGAVTDPYRRVGTDALVVPYLPGDCFADREAVARTATRLSELAGTVADRGFEFCYHNHDHEFAVVDGRPAWERLVEGTPPAVGYELDVGWARAAGRDPAALLDRYGDRIPLVHLKDVDVESGRPVELGDGDVDLAACLRAAGDAGVDWVVYEHDDPDDPAASLRRGAAWLLERP